MYCSETVVIPHDLGLHFPWLKAAGKPPAVHTHPAFDLLVGPLQRPYRQIIATPHTPMHTCSLKGQKSGADLTVQDQYPVPRGRKSSLQG
jgi:hypothetical protein